MMTPVFGPDASVLLTFDWNLNGDLGAVLLVLLLAVLLWDLVTVVLGCSYTPVHSYMKACTLGGKW